MKINGLNEMLLAFNRAVVAIHEIRWVGKHTESQYCSWDDLATQLNREFTTTQFLLAVRKLFFVTKTAWFDIDVWQTQLIELKMHYRPSLAGRVPGLKIP